MKKTKIFNITQKGSRYHLDPIKEETRKLDLAAMIFRRNHKSSHSELKSTSLDKATGKEIDHGRALPLRIEYLQNTKNAGVVPLRFAEQTSINEKGEHYIKICVTYD